MPRLLEITGEGKASGRIDSLQQELSAARDTAKPRPLNSMAAELREGQHGRKDQAYKGGPLPLYSSCSRAM